MSIKLNCPGCKTSVLVNDQWAGKRVRCKTCQAILAVPTAGTAALTNRPVPVSKPGIAKPPTPRPGIGPGLPAKPVAQKPVAPKPASPAARTSKPAAPPPPREREESDLASLEDLAALGEGEIAMDDPPPPPPKRIVVKKPSEAKKSGGWFGSKPQPKPSATYPGSSRYSRQPVESGFKYNAKRIWSGIVIVCFVLGIAAKIVRGILVATGNSALLNTPIHSVSATASEWQPSRTAATIPPRPEMTQAGSFRTGQVTLTNRIGLQTVVKVYLPNSANGPKTVGCVLVAPAGSIQIVGMGMTDEDSIEQTPYAQAGFAVVAYSLSGPIGSDIKNVTNAELKRSAEQFHAAEAGVVDAVDALNFALARFPEIDPDRIGCAGHSSAATHAMVLSHKEARIKACAAYAPDVDIPVDMAKAVGDLRPILPSIDSWIASYSPNSMGVPRCPTLLFHARDDSRIPFSRSNQYALLYPEMVKFDAAQTGDHFESMLEKGIPAGIAFFREHLK